ncbi:MAG: hypothetical protein PHD81_03065 [Candidatus Nanoarchaeia archaeon]|nr:hypothetical protein [Candidatus Nanoarchaeia archaeon]MDD5588065.1 hypothetical protein [Candidatus Nanoarchaeia archaeon]
MVNIIGDKTESKYDPHLAERLNKEVEEKIRREKLEKKKLNKEEEKQVLEEKVNPQEKNPIKKPKIELTPLGITAVNTKTQEEYQILMQVYEIGGWGWPGGELPTSVNRWNEYKQDTCIDAMIYSMTSRTFRYTCTRFNQEKLWNIISPQEFYEKQNITPEMLKEIGDYFKNKK